MINSHPVKRKTPTTAPSSSNKRHKPLHSPGEGGSKDRTTSTGLCSPDREIRFDLSTVTSHCRSHDTSESSSPELGDKVIGRCEEGGQEVWLVVHNAAIACFNLYRWVLAAFALIQSQTEF